MSQNFCNIWVTGSPIHQLRGFLCRFFDCEMSFSPDTLSTTHLVCLYGLDTALESMVSWLSYLFLLIEIFSTRRKFPELHLINCTFTLRPSNIYSCFFGVMTQFELVKQEFLNLATLHAQLCSFKITHGMNQWTTCERTNYQDTINHTRYILRLELFRSSGTRVAN